MGEADAWQLHLEDIGQNILKQGQQERTGTQVHLACAKRVRPERLVAARAVKDDDAAVSWEEVLKKRNQAILDL